MPRGVNEKFLRILHHERRARLRSAALFASLLPLAYFMAELVDGPLLGRVVLATLTTLLLGTGAGLALGHWRTKRYNDSILQRWNAWQRSSTTCTRVDEVHRHAESKDPLPAALPGILGTTLFAANLLLFAALWVETAWAATYGTTLCLLNGLTLGVVVGNHLWTARWTHQIRKALDDLATEGQLTYWGEI